MSTRKTVAKKAAKKAPKQKTFAQKAEANKAEQALDQGLCGMASSSLERSERQIGYDQGYRHGREEAPLAKEIAEYKSLSSQLEYHTKERDSLKAALDAAEKRVELFISLYHNTERNLYSAQQRELKTER